MDDAPSNAGTKHPGNMGLTRHCITAGNGGARWACCPDDGRPVRPEGRAPDCHDRRDLPKSPPHGFQPWGKKGDLGRLIGRTKGGMNTKLHAVTDANGRPLSFFITAGQISDYTGAAALLDDLPKAQWILADRGYETLNGSGTRSSKGASSLAFRIGNPAPCPSNTTSADTNTETVSRSCLAASRIGDASQRDMTDAQPSSSPPSLWQPPYYSGCNQRVLSLKNGTQQTERGQLYGRHVGAGAR